MTSIGNEAELKAKIDAGTATTTKVGEEIKRLLARESNISPETMTAMDNLANGLIALDLMVDDEVVIPPPEEEPPA